MDLAVSVLDFLHLGLVLLLQAAARLDFLLSSMQRMQLGLFPFVLDSLRLDLALFLRSHSRMGPVLSAPDFLHLGSFLSCHAFA